ncbi:MAG: undecaprenyldiphospho-muramoylpentapeptide beta-N-acetylglucosaminyltransferase [Candidatus Moranbacteria bacterium]|nr:undecaprenyldiphospho-muramoylpentapeptide beta-N-acetylglucosaminyltransferase [Candidatus Moranbacteria bacterium]
MRIVLTGGGTGGHIYPLVAVARKLKEKNCELLFVGPAGEMEKKVMTEEGIKSKHIATGKFRRYFSFQTVTDAFKVPFGIMKALLILLIFMPDAVFSKGGYASFPVIVAAWIYRIPILTHESDSIPGISNRIIGKLSRRVAISYPRARRYFLESKVLLTGNPIREGINQGSKEKARQKLGLTEIKPVTLILGGSQGAQNINKAVTDVLPELLKSSQVIHQTGPIGYDEVVRRAAVAGIKAGREGYHPVPFIEAQDLSDFFAVADLVISRAGSNSISEIAANKKVALLIPLSNSANNHQSMNAYELAEAGGALVLEESNLGRHIVMEKINKLLTDTNLRSSMSKNIQPFYHSDATDKIITGIMDMVK